MNAEAKAPAERVDPAASSPRPWSVEMEATPLRRAQARLNAASQITDLRLRSYHLAEALVELDQAEQQCAYTRDALNAANEELSRLLRDEGDRA